MISLLRRAAHRVPVGADDDGPVGLRTPPGAGKDPDDVAARIRLFVVLKMESEKRTMEEWQFNKVTKGML